MAFRQTSPGFSIILYRNFPQDGLSLNSNSTTPDQSRESITSLKTAIWASWIAGRY